MWMSIYAWYKLLFRQLFHTNTHRTIELSGLTTTLAQYTRSFLYTKYRNTASRGFKAIRYSSISQVKDPGNRSDLARSYTYLVVILSANYCPILSVRGVTSVGMFQCDNVRRTKLLVLFTRWKGIILLWVCLRRRYVALIQHIFTAWWNIASKFSFKVFEALSPLVKYRLNGWNWSRGWSRLRWKCFKTARWRFPAMSVPFRCVSSLSWHKERKGRKLLKSDFINRKGLGFLICNYIIILNNNRTLFQTESIATIKLHIHTHKEVMSWFNECFRVWIRR